MYAFYHTTNRVSHTRAFLKSKRFSTSPPRESYHYATLNYNHMKTLPAPPTPGTP